MATRMSRPVPGHRAGSESDRTDPVKMKRPRTALGVDGPLDRPQHLGACLPLVEEHRLGTIPQRRVGVRPKREGLALVVEPHDARSVPQRCRGLA